MMRNVLLLLIGSTFMLCSCAQKTVSPAEIKASDEELRRGYCSEDPKVAENALLAYRSIHERWKSNGITMFDYEYVFGWTDARLMKLYSHIGDAEKAEHYFRSAVSNLVVVSAKRRGQPEPMTREQLVQELKRADAFLYPELKWSRGE